MRILVTGGAGFIGSHVVDRLIERGDEVIVLDNLDPQVHGERAEWPAYLARHSRAELIHADVRDPSEVERALNDVDRIAHLAAAVGVGQSMYRPRYYTSANVDGTGALLEGVVPNAAKVRRLVVASSMSIYGEGAYSCSDHGRWAPPPRDELELARGRWELVCPRCGSELEPILTSEDKPLQATSIYAITKKTQEELALCFGAAYGIPTLALRFFNVFGSRQALSNPYTGVAAIFMARLKNGRAPLVFEDGRQSRDFIHVHDVADAVVAALDAGPEVTGAVNVCTGRPTTIAYVAEALAERLGVVIEPELVGRYRAGDIRHCLGDPTRARDAFGFEASRSFAQGLDELLAWAEAAPAEDKVEVGLEELRRQGLVR